MSPEEGALQRAISRSLSFESSGGFCHSLRVPFARLPTFAAWRHRDARSGFEVVFFETSSDGHQIHGHTTAVEDGNAWAVRYSIAVDSSWTTRQAAVSARSAQGRRELTVESVGDGAWLVDGTPAAELSGCMDVD